MRLSALVESVGPLESSRLKENEHNRKHYPVLSETLKQMCTQLQLKFQKLVAVSSTAVFIELFKLWSKLFVSHSDISICFRRLANTTDVFGEEKKIESNLENAMGIKKGYYMKFH